MDASMMYKDQQLEKQSICETTQLYDQIELEII